LPLIPADICRLTSSSAKELPALPRIVTKNASGNRFLMAEWAAANVDFIIIPFL
jgi:hypothetical protein